MHVNGIVPVSVGVNEKVRELAIFFGGRRGKLKYTNEYVFIR